MAITSPAMDEARQRELAGRVILDVGAIRQAALVVEAQSAGRTESLIRSTYAHELEVRR